MGEAHCMSLGVCYGMAWHVISYGRIEYLAADRETRDSGGPTVSTSSFFPRPPLGIDCRMGRAGSSVA